MSEDTAERIRTRLKRTAEDIVAIGQDLIAAKALVGHGNFAAFLQAEFSMDERTARRFMEVAERFGAKTDIMSDLPPTVLYLLAAPSTPDAVVDKVATGAIPATSEAIKAAKEEARKAKLEAEQMQEGAHFPPVTVFYDGTAYWLSSGFHRIAAAKKVGLLEFEADVRQGTQRDAILHSVGENATHGLRRTNADKRRAVETLLRDAEWRQWSNVEIAKRCAVAEGTVRNIRAELEATSQITKSEPRKGADGRTINTANIGKPAPTPAYVHAPAPWADAPDPSPYEDDELADAAPASTSWADGVAERDLGR